MPIAKNFTSVFSQQCEIDFTQCFPNGRLRYTDLCNILQLTAGEHALSGGISFTDMQQHDQAWVLSRMRVEILELPKWTDIVTIKTWIVDLENSRSVRALEMHLGEKKIVGCETFWAVFNTKTRRPEALALPTEHFEKFPDRFSTVERTKRIALDFEPQLEVGHKVLLSDLDIVNHANNVKYLEWCLDQFDVKAILSGKIKSLDMNFMKELVFADEVKIRMSTEEKNTRFTIAKNEKSCFALEIDLH